MVDAGPEDPPTPTRIFSERRTRLSPSTHSLFRTAGGAIVAAAALVGIVYFVAAWFGDDLIVAPEFGGEAKELPLEIAVAATAFGGILGTLLAVMVRRFTSSARTAFLTLSTVGLVLYGILAFKRAEAASTAIWLNTMHIAAAIPIVSALTRWLPHKAPQAPDAR